MSLIKCKACGTQISKKAKLCPSCGEPTPKKTSFVTWGILIIIVLGVIGSLNSNNTVKTKAEPQFTQAQKSDIEKEAKERALRGLEVELTVKSKRSVFSLMKDPDSTKFKNVFFNQTKKGGAVICGNYDSKNSFGAYSGFKRFISNGTTTFIEEKDTNIADIWVETCLKEKHT